MRTHIHVHAHIRPNGQQSSAARDRIFSRLSWVRRQWVLTRSTCSPSDIGSSPFSTKTYYRHLIFVKDHGRKQKRIHTSHAHAPIRTPTFAQTQTHASTHDSTPVEGQPIGDSAQSITRWKQFILHCSKLKFQCVRLPLL